MGSEAFWGAVGASATALTGLIVHFWNKASERRAARDFALNNTQSTHLELERANRSETWAILAELKVELAEERAENVGLRQEFDRVRDERDAALSKAHKCEIAAREAASYWGKVEQLQLMLKDERVVYVEHTDRMESEIVRLRQEMTRLEDRHRAEVQRQAEEVIAAIREKQHEIAIARGEIVERDRTISTLQATVSALRNRQTGPLE